MRPLLHNVLMIAVNTTVISALLLFGIGFFPHKAFIPGKAEWPGGASQGPIDAPFDKVILMVVDALRRSLCRIIAFLSQ